MATLLKSKSLNYSDVNLIAQKGKVNSRKEISNEPWRIVISGMSSIVGPSFIKACSELSEELQPTIHVPRDVFQEANLIKLFELKYKNIFVGIGLKTTLEYLDWIQNYVKFDAVLLDVANGYLPSVIEKVEILKAKGFLVCTGSVHTVEGYILLKEAGVNIVRSGIGPGSVCITADSTGFTRGTFTEIFDMRKQMVYMDDRGYQVPDILADGGFVSSADFIKAFLAGADYCMSGSIFTKVQEARMHTDGYGEVSRDYEIPMHTYFGMASAYGKMCMGSPIENIEGTTKQISNYNLIPLKKLLETLWSGIVSGVSYSGYSSLTNAIGQGIFESKI